ncbi:MAG TPA: hypothetical protein VHX37_13370 [Acidobacteriaceae bacterium]|jgi:hypothetical protein|nr:hypothetical protein [Acidobacteriaceae bacterium]
MLQTRLFLSCDGDGCANKSPVVDGAIRSHTWLRAEMALAAGWVRIGNHDYCDRCAFLYTREPKGRRK